MAEAVGAAKVVPNLGPPMPKPNEGRALPSCPGSPPDFPVGGCLQRHADTWEALGAHPAIVRILREGYRIDFLWGKIPPLTKHPLASGYADPEKNALIREEISSLLLKGAVEEISDGSKGFYSRIFLRPKRSGGWRPILDLKRLNQRVNCPSFKQDTVATVKASLRAGQWAFSLDMKDAFFQVPVHPSYRRYLRFSFEGKVYQYKVLPFGLCTSPLTFTKVVSQVKVLSGRPQLCLL